MTHKRDRGKRKQPDGHAAERLREFIDQRFPEGIPAEEAPRGDEHEEAHEDVAGKEDQNSEREGARNGEEEPAED